MRFLKTFFRFFTIVTLCTTFTNVACGLDIDPVMKLCDMYTEPTVCQSNNCQWNSTTSECVTFGQVINCENYTEDGDCEAQKGCSWKNDECVTTPAGEYNDGGGTQPCPPNLKTDVTYWESGMQSSLCRYYRPACAEDEYFSYSQDGKDDQCKKCDVGEHTSRPDTYTHICFYPTEAVNIYRVREPKDYYWCTASKVSDFNTDEIQVNITKRGELTDVYCESNSYNLTLELQYDSEFNDGSKVAKFAPENIVTGYLYDKDSNDITSSETAGVKIDLILNNHLKGRFSNVSIKSKDNGNLTIDYYNTNPKQFKTTSGFDKKEVFKNYADNASVPFVLDVTSATPEKYTYYIVNQNVEAELTSSDGLSGIIGEFNTAEATYGLQTAPSIGDRSELVCTTGKYIPTSNITYTAYIDCELRGRGAAFGAQDTRTIVCNANNKRTLTPGTGTYYVPPPSDARELPKQLNGVIAYNYKLITVLVPQEQDCSTGHYCSGCAIRQCTAGTYQDATGQSGCKICSDITDGKYPSSAAGSDSISDCYLTLSNGKYVPRAGGGEQDCPAGSYCNKSGTAVYYSTTVATSGECAVGTYSGTGQTSCSNCGPGKKTGLNDTGATTCTACAAGTYSNGTANATCTNCAAGKYQDETGKSFCKPCNNGKYQNETGQTSCKICADGTYTPTHPLTESFAACISCASNAISNSNHNGCDTCQASDGQISYNNQCRVCPSGTKVNTAGNGCEVCASGTYNESAKGFCDLCGSGFITDIIENTDSATKDIAPKIGASVQTECYLNPGLKLKDSKGTSNDTLEKLSGTGVKIFYVGSGSQQ